MSEGQRRYLLGLLTTVGVVGWVDRQIFAVLLQSIKVEFTFSDTQLGLLGGVAFGLFYAAVGLPVASWADRGSRKALVAGSLALWSVMTALCGAASGFTSLFLARVGVGIGEAGGSAPSQSMVADAFPREERGTALGVLMMYLPLGTLSTFLIGGWVNQLFGWRAAFVVVGLPGLLLAGLVHFTLREPPRAPALEPSPALHQALGYFLATPALRHLPVGGAIHGIGAWGAAMWLPSYFQRVHGMQSGEIGTWLAVILGLGGALGTSLGGAIADRRVKASSDPRWHPWLAAGALAVTVPFSAAVYLSPSPYVALLIYVVPAVVGHMFLGPVMATLQELGGPRRRAMVAAFYLFLANLISMTVGPLVIGMLSDHFHARYGDDALRYSLLALVTTTSLWAAGHFLWASRTLREDLARAARG